MSKINNSVNIPGPIAPYDSNDTYPTHSAIYGKGGWKSVGTLEALKLIPQDRLEDGCIVRIVDSDSYGNPAEFYFDSSIIGKQPDTSITGEIEKEVYKYGFRKWTPGYLPTKVSELRNDSLYIAEVTDDSGIPIEPNETNINLISDKLLAREEDPNLYNEHQGLYNELGKAFVHKNKKQVVGGKTVYGLVTVGDDDKIDPSLLQNSVIYVVMLEGFFPDDIENGLLTNGYDETRSHPKGMSEGAQYFINGSYAGTIPEDKYQIAVANGESTWTTDLPSKECIYVNKARNEAYICEDYYTELTCIGHGTLVNDLGEFGEDEYPEDYRNLHRWDEIPLSAEMGYWLKQQIEMVFDCVIDGINSRLDQEIEDRRNADDVIRNYTVNSIPISQNPVINGSNAYLTGYTKDTSGSLTASDSINSAFSKLETAIDNVSSSGGAAADLIDEHAKRTDNPHKVTRDQLGLAESASVTFAKVTAPNGFFQDSDIRLKENIEEIKDKAGNIRFYQFNWKDTGKRAYGTIADELEKTHPELVSIDERGYKTVNYTEALVLKVSELENRIKSLEEEIEELKNNE